MLADPIVDPAAMAKRKAPDPVPPAPTPAPKRKAASPEAPPPPPSIEPADTVVDASTTSTIHEDRRWSDDGWTAQVIKNEDDDGWAVAMTLDGQAEPSLVGPWTMGRDKKNPKPLDASAFATLVKTASEIIRRHEQQTHAALHKSTKVASPSGRIRVALDIVPDEDNPYAELSASNDSGEELARIRVPVNFNFNHDTATRWVASGFAAQRGIDS